MAPTKAPTQAATTVVKEMPPDEAEEEVPAVEEEEGKSDVLEEVPSMGGVGVMTGMLDPAKATDTLAVSLATAVFMASAVPVVVAPAVIAVSKIPATVGAELTSVF